MLIARERFLAHLLAQGTSVRRVRSIAAMLLNITEVMDLKEVRPVELPEVEDAAARWSLKPEGRNRNGQVQTVKTFTYLAKKWFRFSAMLVEIPIRIEPDDSYVEQFVHSLKVVRGMGLSTVSAHRFRVRSFLRWNRECNRSLSEVSSLMVDAYIISKVKRDYKPSYVRGICQSLQLFFHFARIHDWSTSKLAQGIRHPSVPRTSPHPKGPEWVDVRRLLDHNFGSGAPGVRATAIISLGAIYGLRSSEIANLRLGDFDWRNEVVTIRRSKSGRVQQFPIQTEVGLKLLKYLQCARPQCKHRSLFCMLKPPYRPMDSNSMWVIVASRLKILGILSINQGVHSLRHACATHLLRMGTPLADIADFLGHSNLRTVSVYAKQDMDSLIKIAAIDLQGIL
jgi:integrase/recombinase XerD